MHNWYTVKELKNGIYSIDDNGDNNVYLICGEQKALLIDTGWGIHNLYDLVTSITNLPLIVVNTHGHPDHVSGDFQFDTIYIGKADIPILEGCLSIENRKWALNNVLKGPYPSRFSKQEWINVEMPNIISIKEGDRFELGNKELEVIELPGHTPGGVVLLDKKSRVLFSGDAIMQGDIWLHLDHSTSLNVYNEGLRKLYTKSDQFDMILPGHGPSIKNDLLFELILASSKIINGKIKGNKYESFVGEGRICKFDNFSIVYDPLKVNIFE